MLQVTLVDKSERFVFKPLLYELINGAAKVEEVAPLYTSLLGSYTTNFVQVMLRHSMPASFAILRLAAAFSLPARLSRLITMISIRQASHIWRAGYCAGSGSRQPHSGRRQCRRCA